MIDWEQRRYEIAKTMLPSCVNIILEGLKKGASLKDAGFRGHTVTEAAAENAVCFADALIKELQYRDDEREQQETP